MLFIRPLVLLLGFGLLSACETNDLQEPPVDLGNFQLGLNIVVADNVQKVPISREASVEEWEAVMTEAVEKRFRRYEGGKLFNLGISVEAYALAPPGIPIVLAPKSVLVVSANIFDDAAGVKLNEKGQQFTVFEKMSADSVIGSGLTRNRKEQMEALSYNAVKEIEQWLVDNPQLFTGAVVTPPAVTKPSALEAAAPAGAAPPVAATPPAPVAAAPQPAPVAPARAAAPAPTDPYLQSLPPAVRAEAAIGN